jgi:ABC-type multidrug transport system ATPase subunit
MKGCLGERTWCKLGSKAAFYRLFTEHNPLYLDLYVREYLAYNADIYQVAKSHIEEVLQMTGLTQKAIKNRTTV